MYVNVINFFRWDKLSLLISLILSCSKWVGEWCMIVNITAQGSLLNIISLALLLEVWSTSVWLVIGQIMECKREHQSVVLLHKVLSPEAVAVELPDLCLKTKLKVLFSQNMFLKNKYKPIQLIHWHHCIILNDSNGECWNFCAIDIKREWQKLVSKQVSHKKKKKIMQNSISRKCEFISVMLH